jgi:hypothetical protein
MTMYQTSSGAAGSRDDALAPPIIAAAVRGLRIEACIDIADQERRPHPLRLGRMEVEVATRVLATLAQDGEVACRVAREEAGHLVYLAVRDEPAVSQLVVSRALGRGEVAARAAEDVRALNKLRQPSHWR